MPSLESRYFDKKFQQIQSATGLSHWDLIVNKFMLKEEIRAQLNEVSCRLLPFGLDSLPSF